VTDDLDALARALRGADVAAALTGAGVSTASGIPSFRGDDGVWGTAFDPGDFHVRRFRSDPAGFWADRVDLRETMRPDDVAPNAAHEALATLESRGVLAAVITQNTDGLHGRAGSGEVVELHGSADRVACPDCGHRGPADPAVERARDGERPPACPDCGGPLKPDVVLFGESLPRVALARARDLAERSDVFLAAGSSLTVEPAASLPGIAARDGRLAVCNLDPTPADDRAEFPLRSDVTEVLPALVERI
jgi:NAD-dependent deacetylase